MEIRIPVRAACEGGGVKGVEFDDGRGNPYIGQVDKGGSK